MATIGSDVPTMQGTLVLRVRDKEVRTRAWGAGALQSAAGFRLTLVWVEGEVRQYHLPPSHGCLACGA
jgi:hypothetical protein